MPSFQEIIFQLFLTPHYKHFYDRKRLQRSWKPKIFTKMRKQSEKHKIY